MEFIIKLELVPQNGFLTLHYYHIDLLYIDIFYMGASDKDSFVLRAPLGLALSPQRRHLDICMDMKIWYRFVRNAQTFEGINTYAFIQAHVT